MAHAARAIRSRLGVWHTSTLPALLDVILGVEFSRFIGPPSSLAELQLNIQLVNSVILGELSLPGILAGLAGLGMALRTHRRLALTLLLSGLGSWLFHMLYYQRHPLGPDSADYAQSQFWLALRC